MTKTKHVTHVLSTRHHLSSGLCWLCRHSYFLTFLVSWLSELRALVFFSDRHKIAISWTRR